MGTHNFVRMLTSFHRLISIDGKVYSYQRQHLGRLLGMLGYIRRQHLSV